MRASCWNPTVEVGFEVLIGDLGHYLPDGSGLMTGCLAESSPCPWLGYLKTEGGHGAEGHGSWSCILVSSSPMMVATGVDGSLRNVSIVGGSWVGREDRSAGRPEATVAYHVGDLRTGSIGTENVDWETGDGMMDGMSMASATQRIRPEVAPVFPPV